MANYTDNMNNSESKSYTDMNNAKSSAKSTTSKNSAKSKSSAISGAVGRARETAGNAGSCGSDDVEYRRVRRTVQQDPKEKISGAEF